MKFKPQHIPEWIEQAIRCVVLALAILTRL